MSHESTIPGNQSDIDVASRGGCTEATSRGTILPQDFGTGEFDQSDFASAAVGSVKATLSDALLALDLTQFKAAEVTELSGSYLGKVAATCQTTNIEMN
jgi:hypothetical protein